MAELNVELLKLIKAEGFRINETVKDALEEFIEVLVEENEIMGNEEDDEEEEE